MATAFSKAWYDVPKTKATCISRRAIKKQNRRKNRRIGKALDTFVVRFSERDVS